MKTENILAGGNFLFRRIFSIGYMAALVLAVLVLFLAGKTGIDLKGPSAIVCFAVIAVCLVAVIATRKWRPRVSNTANTMRALKNSDSAESAEQLIGGCAKDRVLIQTGFMVYVEQGAAIQLKEIVSVTVRRVWRPLFKKYLESGRIVTVRDRRANIVTFKYPKKGAPLNSFLQEVKAASPSVKITDNSAL